MPYNYPNPTSRYQPIWEKLKSEGTVSLIIVPSLAKRILKAVRKRRDIDLLYKYELAEKKRQVWIEWKLEGTKMTFTLRHRLSAEDL